MKKTSIITAAVLAASFGLVGCGGGSSSDPSAVTTLSGKAIDPELVGATVCFDINDNGTCESNEPKKMTDMNGAYEMTVSLDDIKSGATLLVEGGYDRVTKMPFVGTMTAMIDEANLRAQMITPLTTLVYERAMAAKLSMEEAQAEVAALLGLTSAELQENMVTLANGGEEKALQVALTLQKSAEFAAVEGKESREFYKDMAQEMGSENASRMENVIEDSKSELTTLITASAEKNLSGMEALRVQSLAEAMEEFDTFVNVESYTMGVAKMQEKIADMTETQLAGYLTDITALIDEIEVSVNEVNLLAAEQMLRSSDISEDLISEVAPILAAMDGFDINTGFGMAVDMMEEVEVKVELLNSITEAQYNEMIVKLKAMETTFEMPVQQ
jgi:hypothetical protein